MIRKDQKGLERTRKDQKGLERNRKEQKRIQRTRKYQKGKKVLERRKFSNITVVKLSEIGLLFIRHPSNLISKK